jgi:pyruvate kinase
METETTSQCLFIHKYPLTKIVATLGPASEDDETVKKLIASGMNVARINCSHGDWEERLVRIKKVRKIAKELNHSVGVLVDLQGPKIRTGTLPNSGVELKESETVILTTNESSANYESSPKRIHIRNYPELPQDVTIGQRILLDDGLLRMNVVSIRGTDVECSVSFGGILKSNKGVNLPESKQSMVQAITAKDREDLVQAVKYSADFIALSFVRSAQDILELKKLIREADPHSTIKTIAKIEKPQALDELDAILEVADGVMVARGDLGVELEPEKVPVAQKEIIRKANIKKKFVITATQMMDSMISKPFPTRAEVSDVANAILDGTDAVMLSNETATGLFPVAAVDCMRKIALEIEKTGQIRIEKSDSSFVSHEATEEFNAIAIAEAVENFARMKDVNTILSFSCSGKSVQLISKLRPKARIIAATTYQHTYNYLSIVWGVTPIFFNRVENTTKTLINIEEQLISDGLIAEGDTIIMTGGLPIAARGPANFVKLHRCDGSLRKTVMEMGQKTGQDLATAITI